MLTEMPPNGVAIFTLSPSPLLDLSTWTLQPDKTTASKESPKAVSLMFVLPYGCTPGAPFLFHKKGNAEAWWFTAGGCCDFLFA